MKKAGLVHENEIARLAAKLKAAEDEIIRLSSLEEKSNYPNLKISAEGILLSANFAAHHILHEWNCLVKSKLPAEILHGFPELVGVNSSSCYIKIPFRFYSIGFMVVPVQTKDYVNVYGIETDYQSTIQSEHAEKNYKLLIENSPAVLIRWKIDNRFSVEFVSENIFQFGYSALEFMSDKIRYMDIIHPQDRARVLNEIKNHQKKDTHTYHQEYRIVTKSGDVRWIEDRTNVDEQDKQIHQAVLMDITSRKNAEELLKSSLEEMKKMNSDLDRFVYSASHDLKAPLRSIMGLINLARTESASAGLEIYLEKMFRSAHKLDNFIGDLINFSKNTRLDVELKEININGLVGETVENLKYMDHAGKIIINTIINDVPFWSDESRLSILFSNLISNAIKYQSLEESNQSELNITVNVTKKSATLIFADNGIGISKENKTKIFNMFFRASDQSEGSGLGLFIVKEIIQKLNGTIRFTSEPGKGTSFQVVLPNHSPD